MRSRTKAGIVALVAGLVLAGVGSSSAQASTICTWGGTPDAPTGLATFSPGVTNTPSTGPIQFTATGELAGGAGCTGKLTFTGYVDPGGTCAANAPLHAKALGFPPIKRVEAQLGVAGSQPVLVEFQEVPGRPLGPSKPLRRDSQPLWRVPPTRSRVGGLLGWL